MMEGFTKGGWSLSESDSGDFDVYSEDDHPTHVAFVSAWDAGDEAQFNAALIAAAPEMYDDIKRDVDWLKQMRNLFVIGSDGFRACSLRIESKQKLLARARGEQ